LPDGLFALLKHDWDVLDAYANGNKLIDAGTRPLIEDEQLYLRLCKLGECALLLYREEICTYSLK
jgi:hypothetical protein